jgi:hypothetical protein
LVSDVPDRRAAFIDALKMHDPLMVLEESGAPFFRGGFAFVLKLGLTLRSNYVPDFGGGK